MEKTLSEAARDIAEARKQPAPSRADSALTPLRDSPEAKRNLANLLLASFQALRVYSRKAEDLDATARLFNLVLADFDYPSIEKAFRVWVRRSNEMPTPADIVGLIERNGRPPLDRTVYVNLSKKQPELRSSEEWAYMKDFEKWSMTGE